MYAAPVHNEQDREINRGRLRDYLDHAGLDELWFATDANFGWLFGGDNLVVRSSSVGVAAVRFDGDGFHVFTDTIEADRLRDEELPTDIAITVVDWFDGSIPETIARHAGDAAAADIPVPGVATVEPQAFRLPLTPADVERLRDLSRNVAAGLEETCQSIDPEDTEQAVAADLAARLGERGIDAPVRLVGGAERAPAYRHFTPTERPVGEYAVVSVSARQAGLWVSASRTVAHDPPQWLAHRHEAATRVEATAIAATRQALDDGTAGDVFAAIQEAYDAVGFGGEWKRHHQGGATGYDAREWIATPGDPTPIEGPIAVAWNPTVQGAKSEDSVLVTEETVEVLTQTGSWPTQPVDPHGDGEPIRRHSVLEQ